MGEVVLLSQYQPAGAALVTDLGKAERLLLLAVRSWVTAWHAQEDPIPALTDGFSCADIPQAALSVDLLMSILARTCRQPLDIRCPSCTELADDEATLLRAARLAQQSMDLEAVEALGDSLLSEEGSRFALGPLRGIGVLFATAGLALRGVAGRRRTERAAVSAEIIQCVHWSGRAR